MIEIETMERIVQEYPVIHPLEEELTSIEQAKVLALFEWGTQNLFAPIKTLGMEIEIIDNADRLIPPIYRVDSQSLPEQNQLTVLFERQDGLIEDSEFIMRGSFRTQRVGTVMDELGRQGYQRREGVVVRGKEVALLAA